MTATFPIRHTLRGSPAATAVQITGTAAGAAAPLFVAGAAAGPVGAAIGLAASLIAGLIANSGCGQTCIAATQIVNQLEPQLNANMRAYVDAAQRTPSEQAAALSVFDQTFAWLRSQQGCGDPALGNAGKRCISDRDRGGKFDWYRLYRDPIANTAPNAPDPNPVTAAAGQLGISADVLIAGGLVLAGALL